MITTFTQLDYSSLVPFPSNGLWEVVITTFVPTRLIIIQSTKIFTIFIRLICYFNVMGILWVGLNLTQSIILECLYGTEFQTSQLQVVEK